MAVLLLEVALLSSASQGAATEPGAAASTTQGPSKVVYPKVELEGTEVRELTAEANGENYEIYVKFPRGYEAGKENYPVLYVLDAETNFGGVTYIVQRLIKDRILPPMLVVGVAYGVDYDTFYQLRTRDLTANPGTPCRGGSCGGGAEAFRKFLAKELFPFIEANYRVAGKSRALYGHSFGGLFGFYTLTTAPEMFDRYLLLSPSLWWAKRAVLEETKRRGPIKAPTRLYVGIGARENSRHHDGESMVDHQLEMVRLLEGKEGTRLVIRSEVLDDETHRTLFGDAFTRGLRFLYEESER
ncbi:MAG: hypothetical protein K8J08_20460 [Thermoanaerobaculia bacterium]|nr:hypothetical protein [Thermoanaerobaculia bacterium]